MSWQRNAFVRRIAKEPTVLFALLAAALFVTAGAVARLRRPMIEIDRRSVELRIHELERGRGASLNEEERNLAVSAYVDEQVLAREARVRGLDDDDRIRSILYQKMLHVLSGDVPQPSESELMAYFAENRARYAGHPAVTVEDCVFDRPVRPGELDAQLPGQHDEAARRTVLARVTAGELMWAFGEETAARVFAADKGSWAGPHRSAEGEHWFHVVDRVERAEAPPLDAIREQVRFDWMSEKETGVLKEHIAKLRRQYSVKFTGTASTP